MTIHSSVYQARFLARVQTDWLKGLLNIALQQPIKAPNEPRIVSGRECSKKFVQQGRSHFDERSVLTVREHGKRARTPLAAFFNIPLKDWSVLSWVGRRTRLRLDSLNRVLVGSLFWCMGRLNISRQLQIKVQEGPSSIKGRECSKKHALV